MADRRVGGILTAVAALLVGSGCGEPAPEPPSEPEESPVGRTDGTFRGRAYERNFVFASVAGDSVFLVPWLIDAVTRGLGGLGYRDQVTAEGLRRVVLARVQANGVR